MGKEWGHVVLSRTVYNNNPTDTTRGTKTHVIWNTLKFLKMCTDRTVTENGDFPKHPPELTSDTRIVVKD